MRCSLAVSAVTGDSGGWVPRDSRPHAAKTRLSQPPKAGGFNGNLGCGLPGSKREDCQSARNNKESLQMQQTTAAAGFAPIIAHPDAMRRRQAAERRRERRRKDMAAMKAGKGWWELNTPENVAAIDTVQQFKDIMNPIKGTDQLVVVDFFAPWCRACRALNPKIAQIASVYPEIQFVKVNTELEELKNMSEMLGVERLPYFHFYKGKDGLVEHFTASLHPNALDRFRKTIAAHKP